ncbi:transglutaminase family protein [Microbacterium sp. A196]|uniref:transglutaminase family protein n=1 Tax=Microbacterium sp. A196 TaxID=3457320 RepID=UPI003FD031A6
MFRVEPRSASRPPLTPAARAAERDLRLAEREGTFAAALLTVGSAIVALWPYTSVVVPGAWSIISVTVVAFIALTGFAVRQLYTRRFARRIIPALAQIVVSILTLTLMLFPQGALLGVIPTGTTFSTVGRLAAQAVEQVQFGVAPLEDTPALTAMLVIGFAAVSILIDQVIATRVPLSAVIIIAAIGALPMVVTMGGANLPWFVLFAILTLLLLRHGTRHGDASPNRTSAGLVLGTGAAAIAATLVITPVLPLSTTWAGAGTSAHLDPSLSLGDDLRRPTPFTVMTIATNAPTAPYLRIASLSEFDGSTWEPDSGDLQTAAEGFGAPDWSDDIATSERRTSIRITGISGSWLPVPYAATKIVGASSGWQAMRFNRTVTSENRDAAEEDYTVTSVVAQPTREQIQAASATRAPGMDVPEFVAQTARDVTAGSASDYDRLIAMQNWFRSQFTYSLDAPVDGDFDGTGADAVSEFLRERSGYCIHFSGAFALMAQSLELQVRIVVGYLPGSLTDEKRGDESIYTVDSDQLHAWPEVHFEGIGWVPFEPTASLGTPTNFQPTQAGGGSSTGEITPGESTAPSAAPTRGPELDEDQGGSSSDGSETLQRLNPAPVALITGGILVLLMLPALVRFGVRTWRGVRARRGDAAAAWQEVRAVLLDLRLPVSDAVTPRMRGADLVERGVDPDAAGLLVQAIERASFAQVATAEADLSPALREVIAGLHRSVDARDRIIAVVLPLSLFTTRESRAPQKSR